MRRAKRWLLIFAALLGLMSHTGALRFASKPTATTATSSTTTTSTTEVPETTVLVEETETKLTRKSKLRSLWRSRLKPSKRKKAPYTNTTKRPPKKLTGIPQIDYVWDPNLPRELNGYNLSSYPFFSTVPPHEEIEFQCRGLHDGFYASIEYKCQVYHHCIYGVRHDFLCANFTAFDQRTFICHFVSEVDCKNSEKFWNRNDNLYMATTTSSTTTTSTPAPPEPEYRPRRRPLRRRRPSDYYYDEDYEDDYYEDDRRVNRRRKQRPRNRRPEYEEDYEERRSYSDDDARFDNKRPKNGARHRDDDEEDYVDDRRTKSRQRPKSSLLGSAAERRKLPMGRKSSADRQAILDERRSLSDDKPKNKLDDVSEVVERRPLVGGRRRPIGDRRPATIGDDTDRPNRRTEGASSPAHPLSDEEIAEEEDEKPIEPKAEKELVRPTSASNSPIASIFDRPRAPPRIARPVPISEKRKYEYPVQKATTSTTTLSPLSDEYYDDDYYEDLPPKRVKETPRRRLQDDLSSRRTDDNPPRRAHSQTRRGSEDFSRRPGKPLQRKNIEKPVDDYDSIPEKDVSEERVPPPRKRPYAGREKHTDEVDPLDDDSREYRPRQRERRPLKKEDPIEENPRDIRRDNRRRPIVPERTPLPPISAPAQETDEAYDEKLEEEDNVDGLSAATSESDKPAQRDGRPVVRVVKRPFLPSRGGSPYLARGLQPVGAALRQSTTDSTPIDMGSTISGVRLLEHGAPILRENSDISEPAAAPRKGPRTTLPPQVEYPKVTLDELYENDYDVTLNDALNPTIKPLSSSNRNFLTPFNKYERAGYSAPGSNHNNGGDSYFSSTDVRRRTLPPPRVNRQQYRGSSRAQQPLYDDFDY